MKRRGKIALWVVVLIFVIMAFGCGKSDIEDKTPSASQKDTETDVKDSGKEFKEDDESPYGDLKKLTIFTQMESSIAAVCDTYNDNTVFKEMEKRTGIEVEFIHPQGQVQEQFDLMILSQDLPDIIKYNWKTVPGGAAKYVEENIIITIEDLLEEGYAPNFKRLMDEYPTISRDIKDDDGRIYGLAMVRPEPELKIYKGLIIRGDWLDHLGLDMPEDTDQLYDVMKAFKDGDPNGNGKADEWAFSGSGFLKGGMPVGSLLWSFGTHASFYRVDGEVKYGPLEPEFKEGLAYINKMFVEGLLDPDYMIMGRDELDEKVLNNEVGAAYHFQPTSFMRKMEDVDPKFRIDAMPHIKGPGGYSGSLNSQYIEDVVFVHTTGITTANEYPKETLRWLDYAFSEEGNLLFNFGAEGVSFEMVDGKPQYIEGIVREQHIMARNGWALKQDIDYFRQITAKFGLDAIDVWKDANTDRILPQLSFKQDEDERIADILPDIEKYADDTINKFVLNEESLDNYDNFVAQLKEMGIEEILDIYQEAYDRYQKR